MSSLTYISYKLAKILVYPHVWISIFLIISIAILLCKPTGSRWKKARIFTIFAFLLFYILSFGPVSTWLASLLEKQHPPQALENTRKYDAIVVLGGGVIPAGGLRPVHELGNSTLRRTICGATLIRQARAPVIIFSGGNANPFFNLPTESGEMKKLALEIGVLENTILLESVSRNTYESSKEAKKILKDQIHILLVTSAIHLPRAVRLYQKQGFKVTPIPCGYTVGSRQWTLLSIIPSMGSFLRSSQAIHEIVGMTVYWMAGKL